MTRFEAYNKLEKLEIKDTKIINGHFVTRWSTEDFEIGTWGREDKMVNIRDAADKVEQ